MSEEKILRIDERMCPKCGETQTITIDDFIVWHSNEVMYHCFNCDTIFIVMYGDIENRGCHCEDYYLTYMGTILYPDAKEDIIFCEKCQTVRVWRRQEKEVVILKPEKPKESNTSE